MGLLIDGKWSTDGTVCIDKPAGGSSGRAPAFATG